MRNIKTGMINSSLEKRRTDRLRTAAFLEELSEDEELAEADTEESEGEEDEIEPEDPAALLAEAYCYDLDSMDAIERQTASLEVRRNAVLRELAWHSEVRARKLDRASREIIDGEFSEAAE
jgi:hypothetical protein